MLFHNLDFLTFFAVLCGAMALCPSRRRPLLMLAASYLFYSWWYPPYLAWLIGISAAAFLGAHLTARHPQALAVVVPILLLPLAVFKYTGFVERNIALLLGIAHDPAPHWALPLGISFITFTAISYVVDAARGLSPPSRRPLELGLYFAFFPHLIAGPILRARELIPQLRRMALRRSELAHAALLFAGGAVKKVVFADGLSPYVDAAMKTSATVDPLQALVAVLGFTIQIYCDFSGYSDMALALAAVLGVRLPRNFNRPYLAGSFRDFWRRWHMTLSRWLRDYIYVPLGGSRHGTGRMVLALAATMVLGGLWHGAAWTFVLWGAVHGGLLGLERMAGLMAGPRLVPPLWLRRPLVLAMVALAWLPFRAPDLATVNDILGGFGRAVNPDGAAEMAWPLLLIALAFAVHPFDSVARLRWASARLPAIVLVPAAAAAIALCAVMALGNPGAFIYFDF